jgi:hypothetical protein
MFEGDDLKGVEIDKCTETFSVKIPEILKHNVDLLPAQTRAKLKEAILLTIARHIHENAFNPAQYLSSREG